MTTATTWHLTQDFVDFMRIQLEKLHIDPSNSDVQQIASVIFQACKLG